MAIILLGKTNCPLCGKLLEEGQEIVSFAPFVGNELDPLWSFSDAAFHSLCFHDHPLSVEATARYEEMRKKAGPGNRACVVCKAQIKDPDDYLGLGYLISDPQNPLHRYNYTHAHVSCLPKWSELLHVYDLIKDLKQSGKWKGKGLDDLISILQHAVNDGESGATESNRPNNL
jgi:hypothetical protein